MAIQCDLQGKPVPNVESIREALVFPDMTGIVDILNSGGIPIIPMSYYLKHQNDIWNWALIVKTVEYKPETDYVALSHL